jgi:tRNA U34 2-thiouridine synthase MnmA/TrmU
MFLRSYNSFLKKGSQLEDVLFPVGHLFKSEVKQIAQERLSGLNILKKKESMGICFIGKRPMKEFLSHYVNFTPGRYIDVDNGKVLGEHDGMEYSTIGQRATFGHISDRYFVVEKIHSSFNTELFPVHFQLKKGDILLGKGADHPKLFTESLRIPLSLFHWISSQSPAMADLHSTEGKVLTYKARYSPRKNECRVKIISNDSNSNNTPIIEIQFLPACHSLTPGQILVLFDGEECLGGVPVPVVVR